MVIGKAGTGKSTLINNIIGKNVATISKYETGTYYVHEYYHNINGKVIKFIDTPGFMDGTFDNNYVIKQIKNYVNIDVILLCHDISQSRVLNEDIELLDILSDNFGNEILRYIHVVFTKSNMVKDNNLALKIFNKYYKRCNGKFLKAYDQKSKEWTQNFIILFNSNNWVHLKNMYNINSVIKEQQLRNNKNYKNEYKEKINMAETNKQITNSNSNKEGAEILVIPAVFLGLLLFSDANLKENITVLYCNKLCVYSWEWNEIANNIYGLYGNDIGYIAQEVKLYYPECIYNYDVYMKVDYDCLNIILLT